MIIKPIHYLLFIFSISCFSQEFRVTGYVKDANNNPIAYANVIITKNAEGFNGIANGTSTDEKGYFIIENLQTGNYTFKVSFLGYTTYNVTIELNKHTKLDTIVLEENLEALDGVTIVAKRPTVKRLVDRLVFNVENSTLSNGNVLDVLKHTPGVLVHDNNITVKNSTPIIYINDRRIHLSSNEIQQLLEGTSSSNVKSIEVITNPPAKYEAEGGSILNIVTSKNIVSGYNGSVFGNYKQGSEFPKYSFGTSHFFKTKKLNTYVNYSINPRKDYRSNVEFINFIDNNQVLSRWESFSSRARDNANQNINANINYELDKHNSLGFSTNMLISPRNNTKTDEISETHVFGVNKILDSIFKTDNKLRDETFNFAFTLDYIHKFKKEGEKLSISTHHTNYDFSSFQNVNTDYLFADASLIRNNRFQTFSSQFIKLYTGQVDYELPINNSVQFDAGLKVSNINSESILNQFNFINDVKTEDLENSDAFLYDETNYALYSSFSKDWSKWSLKTGLRVEYTDIKGNSLSTDKINNDHYAKIFPSIYLINRINDNNEIYFNYKRRINRPRYSQLNPFKYFLNDNAYIIGNPNLKPRIDDVLTLGYTFNKDFSLELYYRFEKNPALEMVFQDNMNNILKYINTNIDKSVSYGLDFMTYTNISSNWSLYALSSIYYLDEQFFALESNSELRSNDRWAIYTQLINYFTFLKDKSLIADMSFIYTSLDAQGASIVSERFGVDFNIKKTILDSKISLSLGVTDIFNGLNYTKKTKYLNQDIFRKTTQENRLLTFGFNYKFGNSKLQNNSKEIDLIERDRLKSN
ncbi:outer membrane beta-barrel protein [Wocania ichthyoenteri]|uniref:outer membrane beta-barrel protein n=1 Tax=Wocania ichthyoenteri TaxID=1230531 RepID=UPI00069239BF|nr:outer membrane beta-barrel family protein [Wocania ichthyoenteri]